LAETMSSTAFEEGENVFEQGDDGDAFYVVTEGEVEVLRKEPGSKELRVLSVMGFGAYFGERALLTNQVRYATVRSASKRLFTVSITRHAFESAIGTRLENIVPDRYKMEEQELLRHLAGVPLFSKLNVEQLKLVAARCTEVTFEKDAEVIRQGDSGDAFYILVRGVAAVLRWPEDEMGIPQDGRQRAPTGWQYQDEDTPPPQPDVLQELRAWDAFGERALLKDEARYATVRVTSDSLTAMSIARDVFDEALGRRAAATRRMLMQMTGLSKFAMRLKHL
jgi:CRP-like cAMP-binding protein